VKRLNRLIAGFTTPWLRHTDQAGVAALVLVALVSLAGYWVAHGGHRGELIDIDRAEPQRIEFLVDINEADWPELTQLPGVGETMARRIVANRKEAGPFVDHEDLRRVRGIGQRTLDRLKPYLLPMPDSETVVGK
jgi:competence protein ComEA